MEFEKFPSLARLNGPVYVTEKIDGTNAQILITEEYQVFAGSRTRWVTPEKDNFGFARWVYTYTSQLIDLLGPGRHYGEWWGSGIQRGYGIKEKRFSLFNTVRWQDTFSVLPNDIGICVVPLLYSGPFDTYEFNNVLSNLKKGGSQAAAGFMNPEGIVIYDSRSGARFKKTFDYDDTGKNKPKDEHGNVLGE